MIHVEDNEDLQTELTCLRKAIEKTRFTADYSCLYVFTAR